MIKMMDNYKKNRKNLSIDEIINILLLSIVTIMPFIVTNLQEPAYLMGKYYYIFTIAVMILLIVMKKGQSIIGKEEKISYWFLISILIASIFSEFKDISIWGAPNRREGLMMFCAYILFFVIAIRYLTINQISKKIVLTIPSIMAILGLLQMYGVDPIVKLLIEGDINVEAMGLIGHRNFFAIYLVIFLMLNFAVFILKGGKLYFFNAVIQFAALLCTATRGVWIGFGVAVLVGGLFILKDKSRFKRAALSFVILVSIFCTINITTNGMLIGKVNGLIQDTVNLSPDSGSFRIDIWMRIGKVIRSSPIVGQGPDTLIYTMFKYHPDEVQEHFEKYDQYIDKSHNEYLEYWVSCGIVTIITYLWLLSVIGWNLFKRRKDDKYKVLLLTFIAYTVQAFFNISVPMVAPIWWIFLGYCVKCYREDDKKENEERIIVVEKEEALI